MKNNRIEILLEKFFEGETSVHDEKILKEFFIQNDIPDNLKKHQALFRYYHNESLKTTDIPYKELKDIKHYSTQKHKKSNFSKYYLFTGVAASLVILISVFWLKNSFKPFSFISSQINKEIENPEEFYKQTFDAFLMVSEKINSGLKPARKIKTINEGLEKTKDMQLLSKAFQDAGAFGYFYTGIQKTKPLNTFDIAYTKAGTINKFNNYKKLLINL